MDSLVAHYMPAQQQEEEETSDDNPVVKKFTLSVITNNLVIACGKESFVEVLPHDKLLF